MSNRKTAINPATLPQTPVEVSLFEENGKLIMRTDYGLSLYTYDRDVDGQPHCLDACSREWPPVITKGSARRVGDWATVKRPDNTLQWSYRGKPVYMYADDEPGTTSGNGIGGVWHLLTP